MLSIIILLGLQFPACNEIKPLVNISLLKMLKYDGEGIPDLVYCKEE